MYDTSNESSRTSCCFLTPKSFEHFIEDVMPPNRKNADFLLVTESFRYIESSVMPLLIFSSRASFLLITPMSSEQFMTFRTL